MAHLTTYLYVSSYDNSNMTLYSTTVITFILLPTSPNNWSPISVHPASLLSWGTSASLSHVLSGLCAYKGESVACVTRAVVTKPEDLPKNTDVCHKTLCPIDEQISCLYENLNSLCDTHEALKPFRSGLCSCSTLYYQ